MASLSTLIRPHIPQAQAWLKANRAYTSLAIMAVVFAVLLISTTGTVIFRDHAKQQATEACFSEGKRGMDLYHKATTQGEIEEADRILTSAAQSCNLALGKTKR